MSHAADRAVKQVQGEALLAANDSNAQLRVLAIDWRQGINVARPTMILLSSSKVGFVQQGDELGW